MKSVPCALIGLVLSLSLIDGARAVESLPSSGEPGQARSFWLNGGGFSRHFARDKGYNESNYGLGFEFRWRSDLSLMAGSYYNSVRRTTTYGTVNWQPLSVGAFKVGLFLGVMDGYPAVARGGDFFVALPMATYEGKRFGANVGLIPSTGRVDGALIVQLKMRLF